MTRPTTRRVTTALGRTTFTLDGEPAGIVWVHTATHNLGGYRLERYAEGRLGMAWIRAWAADNLTDGEVSA